MTESGKDRFLIDGFPRNEENRAAFEADTGEVDFLDRAIAVLTPAQACHPIRMCGHRLTCRCHAGAGVCVVL